MLSHKKASIFLSAVTLPLVLGLVGCGNTGDSDSRQNANETGSPTIALLLPENVNPRWEQQDAPAMKDELEKLNPDATLLVMNADNDAATQQSQAEQALTKGASVLVVAAIDGTAAANIAAIAERSNVPVVAYDRMIQSKTNIAGWIQADMVKIGEDQAQWMVDQTKRGDTVVQIKGSPTDSGAKLFDVGYQNVLGPLYESKERILGYDTWTPGWDPVQARSSADQALTKLNNNVQGVLASNDGNAAAAVASLAQQKMDGTVPVTGLDGTVQALQLILQGKQGMTIWRPFAEMGQKAAQLSMAIVDKEDIGSIATVTASNEVGAQIPQVVISHYVGAGEEGVKYIVDNDPSIAKEDVCNGVTTETAFCK